jgi:hypothetical protein
MDARKRASAANPRWSVARYCRNSIPCARVRIQIGDWPRRHSCARSRSLSSHSLLYPCPQPAPVLTAVGARITAPAIAGSTAATPRSSNASRACRAFMDFARPIRTPARVTEEAGAGTSRRAAEREATGAGSAAQQERGAAISKIRVNCSAMGCALRTPAISLTLRSG